MGTPWQIEEFANTAGASVDTARRWRSGARRPLTLHGIERALFGANPAYDADRRQLRDLHAAARGRPDLASGEALLPDTTLMVVTEPAEGHVITWMPRKPRVLYVRHVVPLSHGGSDTDQNIQLCCEICKRQQDFIRWNTAKQAGQ